MNREALDEALSRRSPPKRRYRVSNRIDVSSLVPQIEALAREMLESAERQTNDVLKLEGTKLLAWVVEVQLVLDRRNDGS